MQAYVTTAVAYALLLGTTVLATADMLKYDGMCAMGLASGKTIQTNCNISEEIAGMHYCFGSEEAKAKFMETPEPNIAKAEKFYQSLE
ncbi:hypothetical protein A7A08_00865 [Methyloligella halotolerans]|uniref:Uncharacterized protein n=1 Tax=Methyloligella halotolerans TaxID=1177755 RepID=A0A1E2S3X0_9HYPH|nr:hypothetical protein [Methyloligella halotolerans]ODA69029.1 hypothetical protein A7A08_00865 [Methyloligella halotolerans]